MIIRTRIAPPISTPEIRILDLCRQRDIARARLRTVTLTLALPVPTLYCKNKTALCTRDHGATARGHLGLRVWLRYEDGQNRLSREEPWGTLIGTLHLAPCLLPLSHPRLSELAGSGGSNRLASTYPSPRVHCRVSRQASHYAAGTASREEETYPGTCKTTSFS